VDALLTYAWGTVKTLDSNTINYLGVGAAYIIVRWGRPITRLILHPIVPSLGG